MEKVYQYLWSHRMLGRTLYISGGEEVRILNPGVLNSNAGPDFIGARLRIGDMEWIGNVEIHVKASDWYVHHHDTDPAYDTVLLHVVAVSDRKVYRSDGKVVPQVEVTFPKEFHNMFAHLADSIGEVRCSGMLSRLDPITIHDWISTLAMERLQTKAEKIKHTLEATAGDWQQACFEAFARALGFGLNSDAFEMLARSVPLNRLMRHSDNLFQIEALLFGQAGMLNTGAHMFDEYYQRLCMEYIFLAKKYDLKPLRSEIWKYSRTRPGNFPHRRIAYLAQFLVGGFDLLTLIMDRIKKKDDCRVIFNRRLEGYWADHFSFGAEAHSAPKALGSASIELLMINLVAPLVYTYMGLTGHDEASEKALEIWEDLAPERNTYTRRWPGLGVPVKDALTTQALIQLSKEYCDRHRCLECRFGHQILRKVDARYNACK